MYSYFMQLSKAVTITLFIFTMMPGVAHESVSISASERRAAIDGINQVLHQHYVFPDTAEQVAQQLSAKLNAGELEHLINHQQFAEQVASLLRKYSSDGHLGLALTAETGGVSHRLQETEESKNNNFAFEQAMVLPGNIGYLKLNKFWQAEQAHRIAHAALTFLSHTDAIIIDLRDSGGGSPELVSYLLSHFVPADTLLWQIHDRTGLPTSQVVSEAVPGSELLQTIPLYVLQSSQLVSAGEFFSYTLQQLQRATIVGETSAGLAHYTGAAKVNDWLFIRIPMYRPVFPTSGKNFEGIGVIPDIRVDAQEALDRALKLAR
ncbi:S41 family peptidase [Alkalimonas collagenimarina]|uniref:S41 family peptidase n=1 Tax=Alkalimonas collagenimarina TaxID=400390 RepID=A0ABT9GY06_9GAMM|nr:S41 family peptidase [Alkalimonas collagenimarina]MDP4535938.1 S41 family peptidase [Alkalimonas collagenimarina]